MKFKADPPMFAIPPIATRIISPVGLSWLENTSDTHRQMTDELNTLQFGSWPQTDEE